MVADAKGTQQYSPFRSWDFDVCVFITFDALTYDVLQALEVPSTSIQGVAAAVPHVGATAAKVHTRTPFLTLDGTVDVTPQLRSAMDRLDEVGLP